MLRLIRRQKKNSKTNGEKKFSVCKTNHHQENRDISCADFNFVKKKAAKECVKWSCLSIFRVFLSFSYLKVRLMVILKLSPSDSCINFACGALIKKQTIRFALILSSFWSTQVDTCRRSVCFVSNVFKVHYITH